MQSLRLNVSDFLDHLGLDGLSGSLEHLKLGFDFGQLRLPKGLVRRDVAFGLLVVSAESHLLRRNVLETWNARDVFCETEA